MIKFLRTTVIITVAVILLIVTGLQVFAAPVENIFRNINEPAGNVSVVNDEGYVALSANDTMEKIQNQSPHSAAHDEYNILCVILTTVLILLVIGLMLFYENKGKGKLSRSVLTLAASSALSGKI